MVEPSIASAISGFLLANASKLVSKVFKRKKPFNKISNTNLNLNINIGNKTTTNNITIRNEKGEEMYADLNSMPLDIMEKIQRKMLCTKSSRSKNIPIFRFFLNDFYDQAMNYENHYQESKDILDKILPYLKSEYSSILKMSSYIQLKYEQKRKKEADDLRHDVGVQYGAPGRKLCNLYLQGYFTVMVSKYLDNILESPSDYLEISKNINDIIERIIKHSEYVFFIHKETAISPVVSKIKRGIDLGKSYMALHSAGMPAINISENIIETIGRDYIDENEYDIQYFNTESRSSVPMMNTFIHPRKDRTME